MPLSEHEVLTIAEYARIELAPDELHDMCAYLNTAIEMIEPVLSYGDADVEPTFHPTGDLANVMGDDAPQPSLPLDETLENASSTHERYFRVPSILGDGGEA